MSSELTKQSIKLSLIVAMCNSTRGIGINGTIPWRLPKDLKHFSKVTSSTRDTNKLNAVVMGRLTWLSIPQHLRPLPNRLNVIISSVFEDVASCGANENANLANVLICKSFDEAMHRIVGEYADRVETIYAIGGSQIYKQCLDYPKGFLDRLYLTRVFSDVKCDVFMQPENFLECFRRMEQVDYKENYDVEFNTKIKNEKSGIEYSFEVYEKI